MVPGGWRASSRPTSEGARPIRVCAHVALASARRKGCFASVEALPGVRHLGARALDDLQRTHVPVRYEQGMITDQLIEALLARIGQPGALVSLLLAPVRSAGAASDDPPCGSYPQECIVTVWTYQARELPLLQDGFLANTIRPWRLLAAPVILAVRDPQQTPYRPASTDQQLSRVQRAMADGKALTEASTYTLTFDTGKLPPLSEFWELPLYDENGYFADNELDRYSVNSFMLERG
jgi:hypothetical protein